MSAYLFFGTFFEVHWIITPLSFFKAFETTVLSAGYHPTPNTQNPGTPAKEEQQEEEQHTQYKGAIYSHSGGLTGQVYEQGGGGGGEVGKPIVHTAGKSKLRAQSRPLTAIVFYWRAESAKSITPAYRTPYVALPSCAAAARPCERWAAAEPGRRPRGRT